MLLSFSRWTAVSPSIEGFLSAPCCVLSPLVRSSCLLHHWELADLPSGQKAIGSRWVFKVKRNADGSIERYKARLVAKGFSQRPGFDFNETFAPTARFSAICTILALSALEDLHLQSIDISHAFINGDLEEEVFMEQPEGFEQGEPGQVLRLKRSLYGLKQASRMWYQKLQTVLIDIGFHCVEV